MIPCRAQLVAPLTLLIVSCAPAGPPPISSGAPDGIKLSTVLATPTKPVSTKERGKVVTVSFENFYALQQTNKVLLYDARRAFFFNLGHIPGAINLPKNSGDAAIAAREPEIKAALKQGKTVVTYCTDMNCADACALADHISRLGYPVAVFAGGWHAWREAEMPTE